MGKRKVWTYRKRKRTKKKEEKPNSSSEDPQEQQPDIIEGSNSLFPAKARSETTASASAFQIDDDDEDTLPATNLIIKQEKNDTRLEKSELIPADKDKILSEPNMPSNFSNLNIKKQNETKSSSDEIEIINEETIDQLPSLNENDQKKYVFSQFRVDLPDSNIEDDLSSLIRKEKLVKDDNVSLPESSSSEVKNISTSFSNSGLTKYMKTTNLTKLDESQEKLKNTSDVHFKSNQNNEKSFLVDINAGQCSITKSIDSNSSQKIKFPGIKYIDEIEIEEGDDDNIDININITSPLSDFNENISINKFKQEFPEDKANNSKNLQDSSSPKFHSTNVINTFAPFSNKPQSFSDLKFTLLDSNENKFESSNSLLNQKNVSLSSSSFNDDKNPSSSPMLQAEKIQNIQDNLPGKSFESQLITHNLENQNTPLDRTLSQNVLLISNANSNDIQSSLQIKIKQEPFDEGYSKNENTNFFEKNLPQQQTFNLKDKLFLNSSQQDNSNQNISLEINTANKPKLNEMQNESPHQDFDNLIPPDKIKKEPIACSTNLDNTLNQSTVLTQSKNSEILNKNSNLETPTAVNKVQNEIFINTPLNNENNKSMLVNTQAEENKELNLTNKIQSGNFTTLTNISLKKEPISEEINNYENSRHNKNSQALNLKDSIDNVSTSKGEQEGRTKQISESLNSNSEQQTEFNELSNNVNKSSNEFDDSQNRNAIQQRNTIYINVNIKKEPEEHSPMNITQNNIINEEAKEHRIVIKTELDELPLNIAKNILPNETAKEKILVVSQEENVQKPLGNTTTTNNKEVLDSSLLCKSNTSLSDNSELSVQNDKEININIDKNEDRFDKSIPSTLTKDDVKPNARPIVNIINSKTSGGVSNSMISSNECLQNENSVIMSSQGIISSEMVAKPKTINSDINNEVSVSLEKEVTKFQSDSNQIIDNDKTRPIPFDLSKVKKEPGLDSAVNIQEISVSSSIVSTNSATKESNSINDPSNHIAEHPKTALQVNDVPNSNLTEFNENISPAQNLISNIKNEPQFSDFNEQEILPEEKATLNANSLISTNTSSTIIKKEPNMDDEISNISKSSSGNKSRENSSIPFNSSHDNLTQKNLNELNKQNLRQAYINSLLGLVTSPSPKNISENLRPSSTESTFNLIPNLVGLHRLNSPDALSLKGTPPLESAHNSMYYLNQRDCSPKIYCDQLNSSISPSCTNESSHSDRPPQTIPFTMEQAHDCLKYAKSHYPLKDEGDTCDVVEFDITEEEVLFYQKNADDQFIHFFSDKLTLNENQQTNNIDFVNTSHMEGENSLNINASRNIEFLRNSPFFNDSIANNCNNSQTSLSIQEWNQLFENRSVFLQQNMQSKQETPTLIKQSPLPLNNSHFNNESTTLDTYPQEKHIAVSKALSP